MNLKSTFIFLILISLQCGYCLAQKEASIWYFGENAGLDFNSGAPVVLSNSPMAAFEGCSSISDATGSILFYTDGISVWNKNDNIMDNGTGLYGNSSSTQSALIVKQPGNINIYYIFTVDAQAGNYGFRYSVVDISAQGGLGSVTQKNISLFNPSTEKICAIEKTPSEIWVMTHGWNSSDFYAYLVDVNGLSATPVISSVGTVENGSTTNAIGYMKFSPDGKHVALAVDWGLQLVELYDFDKSTGTVSNALTLAQGFNGSGPYGVEFSPNSQVLYVLDEYGAPHSQIYQWNLSAGTDSDIVNSVQTFGEFSNGGALQLAPDGKIYFAQPGTDYLGVINNPDAVGVDCNVQADAINLFPATSNYGLPGFVQSYFSKLFISVSNVCYGDSTTFSLADTTNIDSVKWNFDDPLSGANNFSSLPGTYHAFTDSGNYNVQLVTFSDNTSDTTTFSVIISSNPAVDLGNDTALCTGETLLLNASSFNASYSWQNGTTDSTFLVSSQGTYNVEVTSPYGCISHDTILITYNSLPDFTLGADTQLCEGNSLLIDATYPGALYLWQDSSASNTFTVTMQGIYWVKITDANGCSSTDSLYVNYVPLPPAPSITVFGTLLLSSTAYSYQWQLDGTDIPGATDQFYTAVQSGTYTMIITDENGCSSSASAEVITGISEIEDEFSFTVYPNPSHGSFSINLNLPGNPGDVSVEISNSIGQMLYEERLTGSIHLQKEIHLKNLSSGIYFLSCSSPNFRFVRKINVIQN